MTARGSVTRTAVGRWLPPRARQLRGVGGALSRTAPFAGLVAALERVGGSRAGTLAVLTYHRVAEPDDRPDLDPALISATPAAFAEQMAFLAVSRPVVHLEDVLAARRGRAELRAGAVMITFDDAYTDFATNAWPVLRRLGLPVTLFVPTAYPAAPSRAFWWDRVHQAVMSTRKRAVETPFGRLTFGSPRARANAVATLRGALAALPNAEALLAVARLESVLEAPPPAPAVLSWDELRRLRDEGVSVAPHTRTHPLLHRVPPTAAREEIVGSVADLTRELGSSPPALAYPGGGLSDDAVAAADDAGIELAFTTERGLNEVDGCDWLRLRRVNVGRRSNVPLIRAQLLAMAGAVRR